MSDNPQVDQLLQPTCAAIVEEIARAVDLEPNKFRQILRVPDGPELGRQISIDATEKDGPMNICRLAILNVDLAPAGEVARIEYEHERQGKFGMRRVYSIQSVRRQGGQLVLLENFLAEGPTAVREADFKPITSESYARSTVLKSVQDWARYRAWQLQNGQGQQSGREQFNNNQRDQSGSRRGRRNRRGRQRTGGSGQGGQGGQAIEQQQPGPPPVIVPDTTTEGWFDPARDGGFIRPTATQACCRKARA